MTHSVLSSFDPLATHPFTNNSGLMPKPAPPSQYPLPIPRLTKTTTAPTTKSHSSSTQTTSTPLHAPQPTRSSPTKRGTKGPIFVPFRPERSSPDLEDILLKKKVSDVLTNKQTWSIDQTRLTSSSSTSTKRSW